MDCCCRKRCNHVTKGIDDTRRFGSKRARNCRCCALLVPRLNASHPNGIFELIHLRLKRFDLHRFGRNDTSPMSARHTRCPLARMCKVRRHPTSEHPVPRPDPRLRARSSRGPLLLVLRVVRALASQAPCYARLRSVDRAATPHGQMLSAGWARRVRVGLAPCSNDLQCRPRRHACHSHMSPFKQLAP